MVSRLVSGIHLVFLVVVRGSTIIRRRILAADTPPLAPPKLSLTFLGILQDWRWIGVKVVLAGETHRSASFEEVAGETAEKMMMMMMMMISMTMMMTTMMTMMIRIVACVYNVEYTVSNVCAAADDGTDDGHCRSIANGFKYVVHGAEMLAFGVVVHGLHCTDEGANVYKV